MRARRCGGKRQQGTWHRRNFRQKRNRTGGAGKVSASIASNIGILFTTAGNSPLCLTQSCCVIQAENMRLDAHEPSCSGNIVPAPWRMDAARRPPYFMNAVSFA
jgi:hypothetical protein